MHFFPKEYILVKIFFCTIKVQLVIRLFLVHHLLLRTKSVSSQPASNGERLSDLLNWLDSTYIAMTRNNLCIITISLKEHQVNRYVNILFFIHYSSTQIDMNPLIVMKLLLYSISNLMFHFLGRYSQNPTSKGCVNKS